MNQVQTLEQQVYELLLDGEEWNSTDVSVFLDKDSQQVRRCLRRLNDKKLIKKTGWHTHRGNPRCNWVIVDPEKKSARSVYIRKAVNVDYSPFRHTRRMGCLSEIPKSSFPWGYINV